MTENTNIGDRIPEANEEGSFIGSASAPFGTLHVSSNCGKTWIDVDSTWDPKKCSLDEHRQAEFAKVKQPGFGDIGKVKPDGE